MAGSLAAVSVASSLATGIHSLVNQPGPPEIPEIPKAGQAKKKANVDLVAAINKRPIGAVRSKTLKTGTQGFSDDLLVGNQSPQKTLLG